MSYKIRPANPNDKKQLVNMFVKSFSKDEPLLHSLLSNNNQNFDEKVESNEEMRIESCSLVAVDSGKIVGATIGKILQEGEEDIMYAEFDAFNNRNLRKAILKIQRLLDDIGGQFKISAHFPECKRGILIDKVYVEPSHRRNGIAKKLILETL